MAVETHDRKKVGTFEYQATVWWLRLPNEGEYAGFQIGNQDFTEDGESKTYPDATQATHFINSHKDPKVLWHGARIEEVTYEPFQFFDPKYGTVLDADYVIKRSRYFWFDQSRERWIADDWEDE